MADEKEVTVKILAEVDDNDVSDLEDRLEELNNNEVEVDVTSDSSEVDNVESSVEDLESEIENVNNTPVSPPGDTSGVESVTESVTSLNDAIGGAVAGLGAGAGLEQMVSTADNINQSWNRLGITLGSYGVTVDDIKAKQDQLTASTGRTGGQFRAFANTMALAGIHDLNTISDAFYAASAGAQISGNSIETVTSSFQRMAMQGTLSTRVLKNSGIELEDLAKTLGVSVDEVSDKFKSMTPEERLKALSDSVKQADKANQDFANSWEGVKNQMSGAVAGLLGAIGQAILPVVIPAMKTLTDIIKGISEAFKGLPDPVKNVIGGFGALLLGAIAVFGFLSGVGFILKGVYDGFVIAKKGIDLMKDFSAIKDLYGGLKTLASIIRTNVIPALLEMAATALANPYFWLALAIIGVVAALWYLYNTNEEFRNSVNHLYDDLKRLVSGDWHVVLEYEQKGADAAVDTAGMLAKNDLSQGLSRMLMGDEAVNQANANLDGFLENIKTRLHEGMEAFWNDGTQGILGWLGNLAGIDVGSYLQSFTDGFNGISDSIMGVIMGIQGFIMNILQIPVFIQQAVQQGVANFQSFLGQVGGILSSVISNVLSFGGQLVSQLGSAASNAVSAFGSGLSGLVDEAWAEFNDVLQAIYDFGAQAISAAQGIGQQIVQAIWNRHSPGIMAQATFLETKDSKMFLEHGLADMVDIASHGSDNIMNGFNLDLNGNIGNTGSDNNGGVVNNFSFTFTGFINDEERLTNLIIKTITDEINWDNTTANRTV
ncbi:MAG: hypothetical protein IIT65_02900 [Lachnospiraceae bacterium]|nr:hypothetical protein [Lachnospiraceae bacterium]